MANQGIMILESLHYWISMSTEFTKPIEYNFCSIRLKNVNSLTCFKTCWEKLWLTNVASNARFLGVFILLPSSWGGSVAVSLTDSRSNSESSLLSKKSFLPTLCTIISQEYTDLVQHMRVARIASVANTLPCDLASWNI